MKRFDQNSPLRRLTYSFLGLCTFLYGLTLYSMWLETQEDANKELQHITSMVVQSIRMTSTSHEAVLRGLGQELVEQGALSRPERGRELIERLKALDPGMAGFGLSRKDGQLVLVSGVEPGVKLPNLLADQQTADSFIQALEQKVLILGRPYFMKQLRQWVVPLRVALRNSTGEVTAVMTAGYHILGGTTAWTNQTLPEGVHIRIVRNDGYPIYAAPLQPSVTHERLERFFTTQTPQYLMAMLHKITSSAKHIKLESAGPLGFQEGFAYAAPVEEYGLWAGAFVEPQLLQLRWYHRIFWPTILMLVTVLMSGLAFRHAARKQQKLTTEILSLTNTHQAILDGASEVIFSCNLNGVITSFNRAAQKMLGFSAEQAIGRLSIINFFLPEELVARERYIEENYKNKTLSLFGALTYMVDHDLADRSEWSLLSREGNKTPVLLSMALVHNDAGELIGYIGIATDITEKKKQQSQIEFMAYHDSLTQLPNRLKLYANLKKNYKEFVANQRLGGVIFIDLDNFKNINDLHGHRTGDQMLREVATRLLLLAKSQDTVARFGGDEFVVLVSASASSKIDAEREIIELSNQIQQQLKAPFHIYERIFSITASIGVSVFDRVFSAPDDFIRQADIAMLNAKTMGRDQVLLFNEDMQNEICQKLIFEQELKFAIENQQLELYVQSKVDALRNVVGGEVLVRWNHPQRGIIFPAEFIPLAEETGLIVPLGDWVIEQSLFLAKQLRNHDCQLPLSVNISPAQFEFEGFSQKLIERVESVSVDPAGIVLEITENILIDQSDKQISQMMDLASVGFKISIDDFGTGYSSLAYLKSLPIHEIKIDKCFVDNIVTDANEFALIKTILSLAQYLSLDVVVEGVEQEAQFVMLSSQGFARFQGFLFDRPMESRAWLEKQFLNP